MPYKSNSEILYMYQQGFLLSNQLDGTVKRILVICKNKPLFTITSLTLALLIVAN